MITVPPRIPGSQTDIELSVVTKNPVRMACEPTGFPNPRITWLKDGSVIGIDQPNNFRVLRGGRILEITSAKVNDSGLYSCSALNSAGHDELRFRLRVHGM